MKKFISIILVLMLSSIAALADGGRTFSVYTDSGALLIDENGNKITAEGEYDMIECISRENCPADRRLYVVSQLDLSSGFFLEEDEEIELDGDITGSFMDDEWSDDFSDGWDEELDDVDEWPVDLDELDEGYDMDMIDDVAVEEDEVDEFGDVLDDDFGMLEDDYMDYGGSYGVALMNSRGELLTGFDYEMMWHDFENSVVMAYNFEGFETVLDEQGNILLEGMYTSVVCDGLGGYFAIMPEIDAETGDFSEIAPIVHITADGAIESTGMYTFSYELLPGFYDGLMCVALCEQDGNSDSVYKYVYIDRQGQPQFGRYFDYATDFFGGLAEVTDENYQVYLIDTNGEYLTEPIYSYFEYGPAEEARPIIGNLDEGGFDIISRDDYSIIASYRPEDGSNDMTAYATGEGFIMVFSEKEDMLMDVDGNVIWRGNYQNGYVATGYVDYDSVPGRIVVYEYGENGEMGFVSDMSLNVKSDSYREVYPLSWLEGEGRYQIVTYDVVEQEYYGETYFEPVFETVRYGVIDQDGNVIVPADFDYFLYLDHDRYWIAKGVDYALIDSDGNIIAKFLAE